MPYSRQQAFGVEFGTGPMNMHSVGHDAHRHPRRWVLIAAPALAVAGLLAAQATRPPHSDWTHQTQVSGTSKTLASMPLIASAYAAPALQPALYFSLTADPAHARLDLLELPLPAVSTTPTPPLATEAELADAAQPHSVAEQTPAGEEQSLVVTRGDSLSGLLAQAGIRAADWLAVSKLPDEAKRLHRMQPGEVLTIRRDGDRLLALSYPLDSLRTLEIAGSDAGWEQSITTQATETKRHQASGVIRNSLYLSALEMGLSDRMIMQLADIFAWDIDFERDVRDGDRLHVIYEQSYLQNTETVAGHPRIMAVAYEAAKRDFQAVYYTPAEGSAGYYNADGRPMRKAFLRTPVEFARISSRYSRARKHPILNRVRAHKGVDYAAAHGTPIRATGDGRVAHLGTRGGYGRTIILEHAGQYRTLYAHMSSYARGLRTGSRVQQGQTIGYVGASGLATGPHLHYEFHKHGQHVDPLSVALPAAAPLPAAEMARFEQTTTPLLTQLAQLSQGATFAQAATSATP